jgi:DNA polymerase III subunit beta
VNLLIEATTLADAARAAARSVRAQRDRKVPVLNCCRLTAGGNLSIYGTDLDTGISAIADCDVIEPGEAVVDAQRLADITGKLKGNVRIEATPDQLIVKCGRTRFTLTTLPIDDYPPALAVEDDISAIDLTAADVIAIFGGAADGALMDDSRIYLAGVHLFSEPTDFGHRLCGVGCDGTALSYAATAVEAPDLGQGVLIHRDTCRLAVNLFGNTGAGLKIGQRLIEFASDSHHLVAKQIDATPSAWRAAVPPADVVNSATVPIADFKAVLERCVAVTVASNSDMKAVMKAPSATVRWDADRAKTVSVALGNVNKQAPAAFDVVFADELDGKIDITLNPKKLLRLLEWIEVGSIRISTQDRGSAMRIDAGPDRFMVLMPTRGFADLVEEVAA